MTDATPSDSNRDESPDSGYAADPAVVDALADHAVALGTVDPGTGIDDLGSLGEMLADASVVGLGEATHGTREFFQLKSRLVRHLVTELGARALVLEANCSETLALDEYVVHGEGDPVDALEGIYFWTWQVESVLALVEWLRAFNEGRPVDDRVRCHGVDAQYTQGAVDRLVGFLGSVDADFLASVRDELETVADEGTAAGDDENLTARVETAADLVPELRDHLGAHRESYVTARGERAWERAVQHVRVIEQASEYRRAYRDWQADGGDDTLRRVLAVRDRAMADNVDWVRAHEGVERTVLWATTHTSTAWARPTARRA